MMRTIQAAMFFISAATPAAAGNAERIAAEITRAAKAENPYSALGDLLLEWDERVGEPTAETFVRDQIAAQRRQLAILSGSCDIVRALERSASPAACRPINRTHLG